MFEKAKACLTQKGYADRIMVFDVSSATVDLAAAAAGVHPEEIAKSMTFMVNGCPVMVVCAGDGKISNTKFKQVFHGKAKMLSFDEVHTLIGHDVGGVCPFGVNEGVKVYLDNSLKRFAQVYPACGSDNSAVRLSLTELEDASGCTEWVDVTQLPGYGGLFTSMHPGFFEREHISRIPEEETYDEMLLYLRGFDYPAVPVPGGVTFGYYEGGIDALRARVAMVDDGWPSIYREGSRVFCAFLNGEVVSFCLIESMGEHEYFGHKLKIGGPGCVGTVPAFRRQGIGLEMIRRATLILKDEDYDISYIHYTGVADWYAHLGYRTILTWNRNGLL